LVILAVFAASVAALWAWSSWQRHNDPALAEWRRYIHGLRDRRDEDDLGGDE
jgi:hypothetical protein